MNIPTVKLGELTSLISSGSTPRGGETTYLDAGPVMLIRSQNVLMRSLALSGVAYISDEIDASMPRTKVCEKDVLLNITGASIGRVANFGNLTYRANVNQHVCIIRPLPTLDSGYLTHCLASPKLQAEIIHQQTGGTRQALTFSQIRNFDIPLPTLEVQRRVAAILDRADYIRHQRQEAIALTEQLLRSTFLEMFGDPVTNPKRWPTVDLQSQLLGMDAGWSANGEPRTRGEGEWGVLKVSAVSSGWFHPEEHKAVSRVDDPSSLIIPKRGDLLFSRANTRELVAATCLVERDETKLFLPDKLWRIRTNATTLSTEYLRFILSDSKIRAGIAKVATGTSGSMLNVSKQKVAELKFPLPPINLQQQFAQLIWHSISIRAHAIAAALEADNLFNSLVQRAFAGQL